MGTLAEEIVELRKRLATMTDSVLELNDRVAKVEIAQTELARKQAQGSNPPPTRAFTMTALAEEAVQEIRDLSSAVDAAVVARDEAAPTPSKLCSYCQCNVKGAAAVHRPSDSRWWCSLVCATNGTAVDLTEEGK